MKLTFTFTDTADLAALNKDDFYLSHIEFPDEALQLLDVRDRVIAIAEGVGKLTDAVLHISCKELSIKHYPIKKEKTTSYSVRHAWRVIVLEFGRYFSHRLMKQKIKILMPIILPVPQHWISSGNQQLFSTKLLQEGAQEQQAYAQVIDTLAENCMCLLRTAPVNEWFRQWEFQGFHPYRKDSSLITLSNNRSKRREKERRQQEKQQERRKAREEKLAQKMAEMGKTPTEPPKTGAGRRIGAVPGVFMGITFRSQLEIRFVTQLEAKKIRWVYEGERLGEGQYLVDFYLPDLKCWVEVKGRIEPRDDYLLKEVAGYLKREREERLFIYTQSKAYSVNTSQFREITHDGFWAKL